MIFKSKSPLGKENQRHDQQNAELLKIGPPSPLSLQPTPFSHTFAKAKRARDTQPINKQTSGTTANLRCEEQLNLECDETL